MHKGFIKAQSGPHANVINREIFGDLTSARVQSERHKAKERKRKESDESKGEYLSNVEIPKNVLTAKNLPRNRQHFRFARAKFAEIALAFT